MLYRIKKKPKQDKIQTYPLILNQQPNHDGYYTYQAG
jgi:hypothetical protein